jgi:hypothetical protein
LERWELHLKPSRDRSYVISFSFVAVVLAWACFAILHVLVTVFDIYLLSAFHHFDRNIFGYICKHDYLANVINGQKMNLLNNRRLPLVLDLDDTLVRLIGNERTRYVSEADAMTGKDSA